MRRLSSTTHYNYLFKHYFPEDDNILLIKLLYRENINMGTNNMGTNNFLIRR